MAATFQPRPPDQRYTNTKLKRIANQKKEKRLSVFQGNQTEKKKNNSGEDDLTYGPRD
jgi:hypothetical protein